MATVQQIEKQIARLEREKAIARRREAPGVLERIKLAIEVYGFTAEDLGVSSTTAGKAKAVRAARKTGKRRFQAYSDGAGNSWAGVGKRPAWFKDALAAGRTLYELKA